MSRRGVGTKAVEDDLLEDCEVVPRELEVTLKHLKEFLEPFTALIPRVESRVNGRDYIGGLLSDLERKSVEPIAQRVGKPRRALQYFIGAAPWDHRPLLDELARQAGQDLGSERGVFVFDASGFPKKGTESVGVARQWCGRLGKIDNCQVGVFLGYASERGHALVDERLYLPKEWMRDKARLEKCHVPKKVRRFRTALELSLDMFEARRHQIPHRWTVGDDAYGRAAPFRRKLRQMGEAYVMEVPSNTSVRDLSQTPPATGRTGRPATAPWQQVQKWKEALPKGRWTRIHVRDGTKGPMVVLAARATVQARAGGRRIGEPEWLLVVKTSSKLPETRYYLCHSPEERTLEDMVHAANARHWVEDCFQRAKGAAGLDQYEVRSWAGWHHHMTLSLLALWFLVGEQRRMSQATPAITVQQTAEAVSELLRNPGADLRRLAWIVTHRLQRSEQARIDHWRKFRRLPPAWPVVRLQHAYLAQ